jgi:hypothetical protein
MRIAPRQNPTYLRHVVEHYDSLPDFLVAVPSKFEEYSRFSKLADACSGLGGGANDFCCVRSREVHHDAPHALADVNTPIMMFANEHGPVNRSCPAQTRPFGRWIEEHVPRNGSTHARACHYSLFGSSAANLRARPRSSYAHLLALFDDDATCVREDAYFMEWGQELVFGGNHDVDSPALSGLPMRGEGS